MIDGKERAYLIVDLKVIRSNYLKMRSLHSDKKYISVIKANAYQHGATYIADALKDVADYFAVAALSEATELRAAGIKNGILILSPIATREYEEAISNDLTLTVFDVERAKILSDTFLRLKKEGKTKLDKVKVHVAVDTGMSRIGLTSDTAGLEILKEICACDGIFVEACFSHFACAEEQDKAPSNLQAKRFIEFKNMIKEAGLKIPYMHMANTAATLDKIIDEDPDINMLRTGKAAYGVYPSIFVNHGEVKLHLASRLCAKVTYVKEIKAGTSISYNYKFTADKNMRVATVAIGYADGYPRAMFQNDGEVLLHGKRCKILGSICMDQMMIDVTHVSDCKVDDEVTLYGEADGDIITPEEIQTKSKRGLLEFFCNINPRVKRIYINKSIN